MNEYGTINKLLYSGFKKKNCFIGVIYPTKNTLQLSSVKLSPLCYRILKNTKYTDPDRNSNLEFYAFRFKCMLHIAFTLEQNDALST